MNDITYTVKITRETRYIAKKKDWLKVADTGNERDAGPVYDYVEREGEFTHSHDILVQEGLLDLDLPAVIAAVNKLNLAKSQP